MSQMKNKMLTLRLNDKQEKYIEMAMKVLEDSRGLGARKVTKTETVLILMSYGMEVFNKKYSLSAEKKAPLRKKKKSA